MSTASDSITMATVTDWDWTTSPDHRGHVPAMPADEWTALVALGNLERVTAGERALYRALRRKLAYRADWEIDPVL